MKARNINQTAVTYHGQLREGGGNARQQCKKGNERGKKTQEELRGFTEIQRRRPMSTEADFAHRGPEKFRAGRKESERPSSSTAFFMEKLMGREIK